MITKVELTEGVSKKTGKPYEAVKITIGEWTGLLPFSSLFEKNYCINYLKENKK